MQAKNHHHSWMFWFKIFFSNDKMMLLFFQKKTPSHEVINFKYIFTVLLIFRKPKHSSLMMTFGLHNKFFFIILFYFQI